MYYLDLKGYTLLESLEHPIEQVIDIMHTTKHRTNARRVIKIGNVGVVSFTRSAFTGRAHYVCPGTGAMSLRYPTGFVIQP